MSLDRASFYMAALDMKKKSRFDWGYAVRSIIRRAGMYMLMATIALPFVFPVYWMFASGLKVSGDVFRMPPEIWPSDPQWHNMLVPFLTTPFGLQLLNSAYIAAVVTVGTLAVAAPAAYAFARIKFRGRDVVFVLLLTALLLPSEVTIVSLFRMMDAFGWINSHLAIIVPDIFGSTMVVGIFLLRQFFIGLPDALEEAGRVDGLGRFGLFFWIALPLARAPLAALAILTFLSSWNDLLPAIVFLRNRELWTVPQALVGFTDAMTGTPIWNIQMAATFISVLPVLLVFLIAQRQFVQGIAGTGIK